MNEPSAPQSRSKDHAAQRVDRLLNELTELIRNARPMPMTPNVLVNPDEVLGLLDEARNAMPDELRAARGLLRQRQQILERSRHDGAEIVDRARREGEEIGELARTRAQHMVERTEVARAAERHARRIVAEADQTATRRRHEVDAHCDTRLAGLDSVLTKLQKEVSRSRSLLSAAGSAAEPAGDAGSDQGEIDLRQDGAIFDQDQV